MPAKPATAPDAPPLPSADAAALAELLVLLGSEVGGPLSLALERLQEQISQAPKQDSRLLAIREPVRRAREAVALASQIGRLASGRVRPGSEACALHLAVRQVVEQRGREAQSRGLQLRFDGCEAVVPTDPALLAGLLHALLDWALVHTRSSIDLQLALTPWPPHARLQCRFATNSLDELRQQAPATLNGLRWRLLQQLSLALGLPLSRDDEPGLCVLRMDFPLMRLQALADPVSAEPSQPVQHNSQPFAGWQAMVVSRDASLHRELGALLLPLGWVIDALPDVDSAFARCLDALPQAILVDGALAGPDLEQWRCHVLAESPRHCFIEVRPALSLTRSAPPGVFSRDCRRDQLAEQLPALLHEALATQAPVLTLR